MRKYDLISALSAETSREVARNEESWKKYLNTASRLYKYPFKDQLLIYAQRPDATACASIEIWNEKMHCWVNKGAKGIALIDEEGSPYTGLRYVFDISDVHKARRIGRFPQLWEMKEEHQEAVLDRLEGIYGETSKEAGFTDRIREIAARIAQDCYGELASDMEYLKEGSFLEELDELNIAVRVRETLADSIAYMVLKRCGMDDAELAEEIQFPYIYEFNTVETLSHIGDSISDLSKPVLMEIGKAIGAYDRAYDRNEVSKNLVEKGLANTAGTRYNALKRESVKAKRRTYNLTHRPEMPGKGEIMMNLTYEKNGDYLIPMLQMDEQPEGTLTKYGLMRKNYLQEHKKGIYTGLLLKGKLKEHLLTIQEQAEQRMDLLTGQMMKQEGVTEKLKAENQMLWVQKMNSIRQSAEEIVLTELVYSL